jgi:hypothetical protein
VQLHLTEVERGLLTDLADVSFQADRLFDRPTCYDGEHIAAYLQEMWEERNFDTAAMYAEVERLQEKVRGLDMEEGYGLLVSCGRGTSTQEPAR